MKYLLKGGRVFDPRENLDDVLDIRIEDSRIKEIGKDLKTLDSEVINANGLYVFPGFIDLHAHFREPGEEYKEDLETGARSAIYGGFTTVCIMPNTKPPIDNPELVASLIEKSRELNLAKIFPIGTITKNRGGEVLSEMVQMAKKGAVAFSDDGNWVSDSGVMRRALEYTKLTKRPIISHTEDKTLSRMGSMNEGKVSYSLGIRGIPGESESIAVFRDISLVRLAQGRLHIAHISTRESLDLLKIAKLDGLWVTGEVTPHHLLFTEENLLDFDTNYKVNPPLRTDEDRKALIQGIKEGVIDAIATDHAPHASFEKEVEFDSAPPGMIGLQTAFSSLFTFLVLKDELELSTLISSLTWRPASIFGFKDTGKIKVGLQADLALFDLNDTWEVERENLMSRSKNTPLLGKRLRGVPKFVFVEGNKFELEV